MKWYSDVKVNMTRTLLEDKINKGGHHHMNKENPLLDVRLVMNEVMVNHLKI